MMVRCPYYVNKCRLMESMIRVKGTCVVTDADSSGDRNVMKIEAKKILQCKDFTIEIQHTWNVKKKVIPVITGATGTVSKSFSKCLSNILGKHEI
jgi:hypothetical protein